ncbi:Protein O-mannosyl-transferase tmtc2 [Ameca splendens]|uniref:Protein O-mannosyl-transferase tmtc2 n=1 Tax=Ameca splendens TaxID=208324 RepID=A0ABV0ZK36_9TELE
MPKQFAPHSLFNMMGEAYMRLNRLEEAGYWYRESLKAKPDHIPAHLTYGKLLSIIGEKSEAEKYYLRAIQLDPTKGNCYMHYGKKYKTIIYRHSEWLFKAVFRISHL